MVFAYTLDWKHPLLPAHRNYTKGDRLEEVGGTYNNDTGSTGGEIDTEASEVLFANAIDEDVAGNAMRIQPNIASPGLFTLTCLANSSGQWWAKVSHRKR